jgi:hypothetical protein
MVRAIPMKNALLISNVSHLKSFQMKTLSSLKINLLLAGLFLAATGMAQNITVPRTPSPAAGISQTIGISTVKVAYSRPSVKGRVIWGALVPYGWNVQGFGAGNSAPWRAGANENTVISFSHPVKVEGKQVPAGDYGLFFVINKDNTGEVILSKDYKSWGSFFYDSSRDQLKSPIQIRSVSPTELLTYDFISLTKNTGELVLNWEKKQFPVKIEFAVDEIVMANAADELKGPMGFTWQGFASAANYGVQNKVNLDQSLKWINQAIVQNNSFATQRVKSTILTAMGKNEEAENLLKGELQKATEAEINAYGYEVMGTGDKDKAIEIFLMNTTRFPNSPNTWDSLGEAYFTKGDKEQAIASFKKSLSLKPPKAVKDNSEKFLKQLGVM